MLARAEATLRLIADASWLEKRYAKPDVASANHAPYPNAPTLAEYDITWKPRSDPLTAAVADVVTGTESVGKDDTTTVGVPESVAVAYMTVLEGAVPKTKAVDAAPFSGVYLMPTGPTAAPRPHKRAHDGLAEIKKVVVGEVTGIQEKTILVTRSPRRVTAPHEETTVLGEAPPKKNAIGVPVATLAAEKTLGDTPVAAVIVLVAELSP